LRAGRSKAQLQARQRVLEVVAGKALVGHQHRPGGGSVGGDLLEHADHRLAFAHQLGVGQPEPGHRPLWGGDQQQPGAPVETFDQAANLVANLDEATYWSLPPLSRRLVNQTVFQRILVHQDLETTVDRTELGQRFEDARSVMDQGRSYQRRSTTNPHPLSGVRVRTCYIWSG
jgi:hypothetical protein